MASEDSQTVARIIQQHASQTPTKEALIFLEDGEHASARLSYRELDQRARAIAEHLRGETGLRAGDRALLVYAPSCDYVTAFLGCLYAGVIAVPAYPPDPRNLERAREQFLLLVDDATPLAVLTSEQISPFFQMVWPTPNTSATPAVVVTDGLTEVSSNSEIPPPGAEAIAFIQYTSGSTGRPKGVVLSHGNLARHIELILETLGVPEQISEIEQPTSVSWLPPYHDMGLIGLILGGLTPGERVVMMSPISFLQKPTRWLHAMSKFGGTLSAAPNFAYDLCSRKCGEQERAKLNLSEWRWALNGAEAIRPETLYRFADYFRPAGFRRDAYRLCYGLAEATLMVSCEAFGGEPSTIQVDRGDLELGQVTPLPDSEDFVLLASSGPAASSTRVRIVDPETRRPCPSEAIGEIWVDGEAPGRGYWNRPLESEEVFNAQLVGDSTTYLRTGDLGFVHDGKLFVTGRLKDMIVIRGRNYAPHDIEQSLQADADLRPGCGVAVTVGDSGDRLLILQEVKDPELSSADEVMARIRTQVFDDFRLTVAKVALLPPRTIPKTSSGKLRRSLAREAYLSGDLVPVAQWSTGERDGQVQSVLATQD